MNWPISALLPHAGNLILLDAVHHFDDASLTASATIKPCPYSLEDGCLPAWVGLELMAQAVGAWAGCHARQSGQAVQLGFLLGTRRYDHYTGHFLPGTRLTVTAQRDLIDASGMGVFACCLRAQEVLLAQARLNVYQPRDVRALLAQT